MAKQEWEKIIAMAHNNGFPEQTVQKLRKELRNKRDRPKGTQQQQQCKKRWINFTYYGPVIRKVTNLFRQTNLQIAFRPTNTIYEQLSQKGTTNNKPSEIYQLKFVCFLFVCLLYIRSIHTWSKPQDIEFVIINYIR
jgi:hypothetical protein